MKTVPWNFARCLLEKCRASSEAVKKKKFDISSNCLRLTPPKFTDADHSK